MTKIYTVKSNARRDARKLGLDPDLVVPVEGGFVIGGAPQAADLGATASPAASETKAATTPAADKKNAALRARLESGWVSASDLMAAFGWQAHTLRGAISTIAKKHGLTIERRRAEGVTNYRVAP